MTDAEQLLWARVYGAAYDRACQEKTAAGDRHGTEVMHEHAGREAQEALTRLRVKDAHEVFGLCGCWLGDFPQMYRACVRRLGHGGACSRRIEEEYQPNVLVRKFLKEELSR